MHANPQNLQSTLPAATASTSGDYPCILTRSSHHRRLSNKDFCVKRCAYCGKEYPDDANECAFDRQPLESNAPLSVTPAVRDPLNPVTNTGWVRQVAVPAG